MNQSYEIDEVILVDDGSRDNTTHIAAKFIQEHQLERNWHLYTNDMNMGYASNFIGGVRISKGEYVFLCDQDDIWYSNRIKEMVKIMDSNDEIKVLGSEYEPFYCTEDAPVISRAVLKKMNGNGKLEHVKLNHKTIFIGCEGCTMCIRQDFLRMIDPYWFSGWAHDEFVWKLSLCVSGLYIYHNRTLKRRLHSNNVSKRKYHNIEQRVKFLEDLKKSHSAMLTYANSLGLDKHSKHLINKNIQSVGLRVNLLSRLKLVNSLILLLFYFNNYHSRKSIPVELLMALKVKFKRINQSRVKEKYE